MTNNWLEESIRKEAESRKEIRGMMQAAFNAQSIFDEGKPESEEKTKRREKTKMNEICDVCGATLAPVRCEVCGKVEEIGCIQCGAPLPPGTEYCTCE